MLQGTKIIIYICTEINSKIMKKTINVSIAGTSFILDEDAYAIINQYLDDFSKESSMLGNNEKDIDNIETNLANLLTASLGNRQVVDKNIAESVLRSLGYYKTYQSDTENKSEYNSDKSTNRSASKLYRDPDDKKIGGVCSGLAYYLGIDVVLIRIIFLFALICGTAGFWVYIIICIAAPMANTPTQKCELRGIPPTPENLSKFAKK